MVKKFNLLIVAILFMVQQGAGQEWLVPEDAANVKNPSAYNLENVKKGKDLYNLNCKSCHGDAGKNNGLPLVPPPPDVASDLMQSNTESALFYKITKGRGGMPQFESTLSEDDRWRLVNYIMNYNPANEPVLVEAPPVKAKLKASVNEADGKVEITAEQENKNGELVALTETSVSVCAQQAFGNLPIGEAITDAEGKAEFMLPETIIGDEQGMVNIVVTLGEGFEAEPVVLESAKVGKAKETPKLIRKGVLWSTNENIPIWLLLSYLGVTGGVWLAIVYVLFLLIKIKKS
ncbi:MAG: cytochrome c [Bacteroidota bacterium]